MQQIGRYEVLRPLGQGGIGAVFEVRLPGGAEHFALKVLTEPDPEVLERFRREAGILQLLGRHPGIVKLRDVAEDRGRPFIVMDLIRGGTLSDRLKEGVDLRAVAAILRDVARALHFAHEAGVIHRDVKPANVLMDEAGRPVLTDFGVARSRDMEKLTKTGTVMGTMEYMSPEQVEVGRPPRRGRGLRRLRPPEDRGSLGRPLQASDVPREPRDLLRRRRRVAPLAA